MASWSGSTAPCLTNFTECISRSIYSGIEQQQRELDRLLNEYNELRPHQGRWCYGNTSLQTFIDAAPLAREKGQWHTGAIGVTTGCIR
jgi:hypothetical protein